jgi:4'-phosphopantetheinyl transferase
MPVDQRIHVYLSLTDEVDRPEAQAACTAILSSAERERAQRLQSERQRREFILAHGLVRAVLSRRVPAIPPADWRFRIDRHGRPFISGPCRPGLLHFSMSHADGCVACAISPCAAIGVDVEATDRLSSPLAIVEHTFSTAEIETLQGLSATEQVSRFSTIGRSRRPIARRAAWAYFFHSSNSRC